MNCAPFSHSIWLVMACLWPIHTIHGQDVTTVSQALPFALTGNVAKGSVTNTTESGKNPGIVRSGETLATGTDGEISLMLGAEGSLGTARLGKDTEVRLPKAGEKSHSLELLKGKLFLDVNAKELQKRGKSEFRLKTPAALLAVKGTRFFAIVLDGKERTGVHEGNVDVNDANGQKVLSLSKGQGVEVLTGVAGAASALTDEENGYLANYDAAALTSIELPIMVEPPSSQQLAPIYKSGVIIPAAKPSGTIGIGTPPLDLGPYIHFRTGSSNSSGIKMIPSLTPEGIVRLKWTSLGGTDNNSTLFSYVRGPKGMHNDFEQTFMPRVVLMSLKVRAKNVKEAHFDFSWVKQAPPPTAKIVPLPQDGQWVDVLVPLLPYPAPTYRESTTLVVKAIKASDKQRKECVLDIANFTLYVTP